MNACNDLQKQLDYLFFRGMTIKDSITVFPSPSSNKMRSHSDWMHIQFQEVGMQPFVERLYNFPLQPRLGQHLQTRGKNFEGLALKANAEIFEAILRNNFSLELSSAYKSSREKILHFQTFRQNLQHLELRIGLHIHLNS